MSYAGKASNVREKRTYLRMPRRRFFTRLCLSLRSLRLGLLMMNVPLPTYSALYNFSSANVMPL